MPPHTTPAPEASELLQDLPQGLAESPAPKPHAKLFTVDHIINLMIANPTANGNQLAALSGRSVSYISILRSSDAFRARYAQRCGEILDPILIEDVRANFEALTRASTEKLLEKLSKPADQIPDNLLLKAAEMGAIAMGVGGFSKVLQAPPSPVSAEDRLAAIAHRLEAMAPPPPPRAEIVDVESRLVPPAAP